MNKYFLPALFWIALSTFLLVLPGAEFPKQNWTDYIPLFDKWVHVGMFAIMVWLLCYGHYKSRLADGKAAALRFFIYAGILCSLYGVLMEFVQKELVPNRSFDVGDIVADFVGCISGYFYSWYRYIKK